MGRRNESPKKREGELSLAFEFVYNELTLAE
jgi:hypothetical protein